MKQKQGFGTFGGMVRIFSCVLMAWCTCGCSAIIESMLETSRENRAERRYRDHGATSRQARQRAFEDEVFKDVGGRP